MDLVVEDTQAEEMERVRARKEGSSKWNENEPKRYMYASHNPSTDIVRETGSFTDAHLQTDISRSSRG